MGLWYLQPKWLWWDWFNNTVVVHEDHMHWKNKRKERWWTRAMPSGSLGSSQASSSQASCFWYSICEITLLHWERFARGKVRSWSDLVRPPACLWLSLLYEIQNELKLRLRAVSSTWFPSLFLASRKRTCQFLSAGGKKGQHISGKSK